MKRQLEMVGCKRIDYMTTPSEYRKCICWECLRPVGECRWLMCAIPYANSEYYERECNESKWMEYSVYAITKCPMEVKSE